MEEQFDKLVKQTYRYYYVDGLVEMAVGFLFAAIGITLFSWIRLEDRGLLRVATVLVLPLLTLAGAAALKKIVGVVKERVTYPRTGYVSYRKGEPSSRRWVVPLAALGLLLLMALVPEWLTKMPAVNGAFLAIILAYMGYRVRVGRFYLLAIVTLLTGVTTAWLVEEEIVGSTIVFSTTGVVMFVSGALVFLNYLRRHPAGEDGDEV
jgi:hypothetical protein